MRIFIGSSGKGLGEARAFAQLLRKNRGWTVQVWDDAVFALTETTIQSLYRAAATFDFAVLIFRSDDEVSMKGTSQAVPRDNVVFEFGLFLGALGAERTFILRNTHAAKATNLHLPSDLDGMTYAASASAGRGAAGRALQPAAERIAAEVRRLGERPREEVFKTIEEGHDCLYRLMSDRRFDLIHQAALTATAFPLTSKVSEFDKRLESFVASERRHYRGVVYLTDELPGRRRRTQKLLGARRPPNVHISILNGASATLKHVENFLVFSSQNVPQVGFIIRQDDGAVGVMTAIHHRSALEAYLSLHRHLYALGTEVNHADELPDRARGRR